LCDKEEEKKQAVIYDLSVRCAKMKAKVKSKPKITIMQKCFILQKVNLPLNISIRKYY